MKAHKFLMLTASVGLVFGMMSGCGGGGSSDSPDVTLSELTPETVKDMAENVATAIPGCSYGPNSAMTSSQYLTLVYKSTLVQAIGKKEASIPLLAVDINQNISGTCPTPGFLAIRGTHENGIDDLTFTFNNYCLGDDVENITLNGVADVKNVGTPSPTGPIPQYTTMSTGSNGIQATEKSSEGTYTHVVKASDLKYTHGNGNNDTTAESPSILTVGSLSVLDGKANETYSVSNVNISTYDSGTDDVITINSLTYTDPDSGSVNISSTAITVSEAGVIMGGELTVTGSNNTSFTVSPYPSVDNAFGVVIGGETIGVMDCSMVAIPELPEL